MDNRKRYVTESSTQYFENVEVIEIWIEGTLKESIKDAASYNRKKLKSYLIDKYGRQKYTLNIKVKGEETGRYMPFNLKLRPNQKKQTAQEKPMSNNNPELEGVLKEFSQTLTTLMTQNANLQKALIEQVNKNSTIQIDVLKEQLKDMKDILKNNNNSSSGMEDILTGLLTSKLGGLDLASMVKQNGQG